MNLVINLQTRRRTVHCRMKLKYSVIFTLARSTHKHAPPKAAPLVEAPQPTRTEFSAKSYAKPKDESNKTIETTIVRSTNLRNTLQGTFK